MKNIFLLVLCLLGSFFTNAQNVGIGTNTPGAKLEVVGQVKITGGVPGEGKILTSDAAGLASWQTNAAVSGGNVGYGVWGDCATNGNISEYNPVVDASGAANDNFGSAVSVSGNYAIIGAPRDGVGSNVNQGSISIFQFVSGNWVLMQKITDPSGASNDQFGYSVCLSGNYAIIGSHNDDVGVNSDQGSVSFYQLIAGNWVFMQKMTDPAGAANDFLGTSVSLSGNFAITGSLGDDVGANLTQGSATVFQLVGGIWYYMQKLTDPSGMAYDAFGLSVSISGNYAVIGALQDDVTTTDQGSASIFRFTGVNFVFEQKLTDATSTAFENFGTSVSISGNYVIIGASRDDVGPNADQGSASIYHRNGSNWVFMQKVIDPTGSAANYYGSSVYMMDNYIVVGCNADTVGVNSYQGSAILFMKVGLGWSKLQFIIDPMGNASDEFGTAIALDSNTKQFLIGSPGYAGRSGKSVFGKIN